MTTTTLHSESIALLQKLFGHRWDDLGSEEEIHDRYYPVLLALREAAAAARKEALEEAAKMAEKGGHLIRSVHTSPDEFLVGCKRMADEIRDLGDKP